MFQARNIRIKVPETQQSVETASGSYWKQSTKQGLQAKCAPIGNFHIQLIHVLLDLH